MNRLAFGKTLIAAALAVSLPTAALAQEVPAGANQQAENLNNQGKELYKNKDYQGAAAKFREANAIQPDARYYFNLCATLEKAGDLDAALEACDSVYQYGPTEELKGKTGQRAASIRQSIRQRNAGGGQPPPGGSNPVNPPPGGGNPPPGGDPGPGPGPQPPEPEVTKPVPGEYKWAFGGEFGPILGEDMTGSFDGGGLLRLYADKSFSNRLGGRAWLGLGGLTGTRSGAFGNVTNSTTIVEFGAAAFTNIKVAGSLYITPMLGVLLAGVDESLGDDGVSVSRSNGTFGVSLGIPISLLLGGGKHVISLNPAAFTYYLPSTNTDGGFNQDFEGGSTFMVTLGYQLRLQKGERLPGFVVLE